MDRDFWLKPRFNRLEFYLSAPLIIIGYHLGDYLWQLL